VSILVPPNKNIYPHKRPSFHHQQLFSKLAIFHQSNSKFYQPKNNRVGLYTSDIQDMQNLYSKKFFYNDDIKLLRSSATVSSSS